MKAGRVGCKTDWANGRSKQVPLRVHRSQQFLLIAWDFNWVNDIELEGGSWCFFQGYVLRLEIWYQENDKSGNCVPGRRGTDGKAAIGKIQAEKDTSRAGRSCLVDWDMGEQRM